MGKQYFYGVLDTDTSKDVVRNATNYQEARFVLQTEDGRQVTLVASMNHHGDWGLTIEDEARHHLYEVGGNALSLLYAFRVGDHVRVTDFDDVGIITDLPDAHDTRYSVTLGGVGGYRFAEADMLHAVSWEGQTFEEWEAIPHRTRAECQRDRFEYHRMKDFTNSRSKALYEAFTEDE